MKVESFNKDEEKRILTALIVNDEVLGSVYTHLGKDRHPFNNRWADLVAGWCLDHFARYGKAPGAAIEDLFRIFANKSKDEDTVGMVDQFLSSLSNGYKKNGINEKFVVDRASSLFGRVRMTKMLEEVEQALEQGDLEEAERIQSSFRKVDFSSTASSFPCRPEEIKETFASLEKSEEMVKFPGALGDFLSDQFKRDNFIAFEGPDKRGKSCWLLEVVWQALKQRRRVLYYALGDMSKDLVRRRFYQRVLRRPGKKRYMEVMVPIEFRSIAKDEVDLKRKQETRELVNETDAVKALEKLAKRISVEEIPFELVVDGGKVLSAIDIERKVKELSDRGQPPDVVVIDYADELAPEPGTAQMQRRDQYEMNWSVMKRIALRFHCLVVTATQTAASAYSNQWVIKKEDFSEDKRKNAKVDGMIGINQRNWEHRIGVSRLNWVSLRDGHWSENQVVWCAGNLSIACPCIISSL